jgi:F0F1-type ATP synthase assembly protein I
MRGTWTSLGLLFRLSALTLGATFGTLLLGIWIDRSLGTAPWVTLCLGVSGILIGTIAAYRAVKEANDRISGSRS